MPDEDKEWVCYVTPDRKFRICDLTVDDMVEIANLSDREWFNVYVAPLGDLKGAVAIYAKCCEKLGVEPHTLTVGELVEMFRREEDDRPQTYTAGMPDPLADAPATPSLSPS